MESAAASAFLRSVMGKLFQVLEKEYNKQKGLRQETLSIQQDVRMIAAAMDDRLHALGRGERRTAVARLYSEEMLGLAHDAQDCIDRIVHRLTCRPRGGGKGAALVRRVAHEIKKVRSRPGFADEIQKLKIRLEQAHKRVLGIPIPAAASCCHEFAAAAPSCRVARDPVGIGRPVEELLSMLDEVEGEKEQLRVISVVGFGGLGKTTLARAVYEAPDVVEKFHCRAWVSAGRWSPEVTGNGVSEILRDVLQQVRPKDAMDVVVADDGQRIEALLKEYLTDKRYLIVIDDIGMEQWSTINSIFENNGKSSRILLTTTIQSTANICSHGNGYVYQMNTLGEEDSKKIALQEVPSPELEQGSMTLLQKCGGLPLALVSVSDFLKCSGEPTGERCAELCRNLGSHLREKHGHDNFTELRKVLMHNYDSLSVYAMTCLLYLGVFPNNRPLKRKVVIRRWLAEGYARSDSLRSEEDIADETFKALVDRNIIQSIDTRNNAQVKTCMTHGIMHEFVLHKSVSQGFIATSSRDHPRPHAHVNNACHLSIHGGNVTDNEASDEDLSRVRSLTVFGKAGDAISYVRKCKLLRVLDLEECNDLEDSHLKHIGKLWHLKYLSVGGTIAKLPSSIDGLHSLETLDLRRTKIKTLPIEAIMLYHLAHLFGKFTVDKEDLNNANKMSKAMKFLSGNKSNLKTLAGFATNERQGFLQLMVHMRNLRKVKIWCGPVANGSNYTNDLSKAIQEFTKVPMDNVGAHSLSLDSEECSEDLLSSLAFEPCPEDSKYDVRSLKLRGKLFQLPPFVPLLSGLTELCISSATLTRDLLLSLINLRNLLYLKLIANELEKFEMKSGAFPSLRRLCFVVQSLTSALPAIEHGALPNLVSLQLLCLGLAGFSSIQIRHLRHLKEVTVDSGVPDQTRQDWEHATKNHPNRPRLVLHESGVRMESEGPGNEEASAVREKRKICVLQPSLDDGLDSSLKKMKLSSESSSRLQVIVHSTSSSGH
ncbi:disease resistance protein RGA4-like [Triticum dicoccoides]|uniref:disease resistance protein RGA4-like n=1 Tax=Triticum dicoccoides TaxID=85692 RepID=UPI000E7AD6D2|nr:disease resistance protein RGA4-like [Triticum dicoccoides]XP_037442976.1 disease resistance protein RGA4-like [Triticum dicoccoides]